MIAHAKLDWAHWCALTLALILAPAAARGDGGLLRLNQAAGPFQISVFTAPTPLRVGFADVSVMVFEQVSRAPVLDANVRLTLRRGDLERSAGATRAAATNKLLYAASLDLPEPGDWTLAVRVRSPEGEGAVSCGLDVADALPRAVVFWPYLVMPVIAIALFAVHQWLKRVGR